MYFIEFSQSCNLYILDNFQFPHFICSAIPLYHHHHHHKTMMMKMDCHVRHEWKLNSTYMVTEFFLTNLTQWWSSNKHNKGSKISSTQSFQILEKPNYNTEAMHLTLTLYSNIKGIDYTSKSLMHWTAAATVHHNIIDTSKQDQCHLGEKKKSFLYTNFCCLVSRKLSSIQAICQIRKKILIFFFFLLRVFVGCSHL